MAFPTLGILDDFNRADGPLVSPWNMTISDVPPEILSNVVVGGNGQTPNAYLDDVAYSFTEAYMTIPAAATAYDLVFLIARVWGVEAPSLNLYLVSWNVATGIELYRYDRGGQSAVLFSDPTNAAPGDKVGMEVTNVGDDVVIEIYMDIGGGGWASQGSYTDTGRLTLDPRFVAGFIGFGVSTDGAITKSIDSFGGGGTTYVVGEPSFATPLRRARQTSW